MSSLSSHSLVGKVFAGRREDGQTTLSHSRAERRPYSQRDVVDRPQELVDTLCESSLVRDVQRPDARRVEIANHVGKLGQALGHARLEQTCARLRGLTSSTSFPPIKDRLTFVKVGTGTGCAVVPVTRARQRCAEVLPFLANTERSIQAVGIDVRAQMKAVADRVGGRVEDSRIPLREVLCAKKKARSAEAAGGNYVRKTHDRNAVDC